MAGSNLLALVDDIATLLDDIAVMSKVAVKKTAGVLGDDLALNAEQVAGVQADRELPVVWAVAKGSCMNKLILVPAALLVSAMIPMAITPLLMIGGLFLCYEGFEKLAHKLFAPPEDAASDHKELVAAVADPATDMVAFERDKIRGAIRTDFVLSAEIIVISLGTVAAAPFIKQLMVLSTVALLMTIGVYGLVAAIVKLDDLGLWLQRRPGWRWSVGRVILNLAPILMRCLGIAGTAAMFMVGGGILTHGISEAHHWIEGVALRVSVIPGLGSLMSGLTQALLNALVGVLAGAIVLLLMTVGKRLIGRQVR